MRSLVVFVALAVACDGCRERPPPPPEQFDQEELAPQILEETPQSSNAPPPPPIADTPVEIVASAEPERPIVPAAHVDDEWNDNRPVHAHRYVYRVTMVVPASMGERTPGVTPPAAELFIDVAYERLRARFAGPGWPVDAGSEVRLRRDRPGVYLFDGRGGRPLAPREMASWFEGGPVTRRGPGLRVFPQSRQWALPPSNDGRPPGELVCALLAEWAGVPWQDVMRRCEQGAPHHFRLAYWRAEQTAGVPVELPRESLRGDHVDPPADIAGQRSRSFFEPAALARLAPAGPAERAEGAEGLRIENRSATRVIVTLQGIAVGWIDAGTDGSFVGLLEGRYEFAAIRPLGALVQRARDVSVPSVHRVCDGSCRRAAPDG